MPPLKIKFIVVTVNYVLFTLLLLFEGGKNQVMYGISSIIIPAAAALLLKAGQEDQLRHPMLPFMIAIFLWQIPAVILSSAPIFSISAVTKSASIAAFGFIMAGEKRDLRADGLQILLFAFGGVQIFLIGYGFFLNQPVFYIIPGNPQYTAFWLSILAVYSVGLILWTRDSASAGRAHVRKGLFFFIILALGAALIFMNSRSGILAVGAGILFLCGVRFGSKGVMLFLALVGVAAYLSSERWIYYMSKAYDPLAFGRWQIWKTAFEGIIERPWFGWGPGRFGVLYSMNALPQFQMDARFNHSTEFAHNEYLQAASGSGIPALLILLAGGSLIFLRARRKNGVEAGILAALAAAAVFSFFNFPFAVPTDGLLIVGLAARLEYVRYKADFIPLKIMKNALLVLFSASSLFNAVFFMMGIGFQWPRDILGRLDASLHSSSKALGISVEDTYRKILFIAPDQSDAWRALAHYFLEHMDASRFGEGVAALEKAVSWNPHQAVWRLELCRAWESAGDLDKAAHSCRRALGLEPNFFNARVQFGRLLRLRGKTEKSIKWFEDLSRARRPDAGDGIDVSSYSRAVLSRDEDLFRREWAEAHLAMKNFKTALSVLSGHVETPAKWVLAARILYSQGEFNEAEKFIRKALDRDPNDAGLKSILNRFPKIREDRKIR